MPTRRLHVAAAGPPSTRPRGLGPVLLAGGLVGAAASLVLLLERLAMLTDPLYMPSCSVDAVLSCGSVMTSEQAALLGFPNPVLGLLTFPVLAALGALVTAGVPLPRWCWLGLGAGTLIGVAFVHWLVVASLVTIEALCPYCMAVWVAVIAMFWFVTVHVLCAGHLGGAPAGPALARRHGWGLAAWYVVLLVAVVAAFPEWAATLVGLA